MSIRSRKQNLAAIPARSQMLSNGATMCWWVAGLGSLQLPPRQAGLAGAARARSRSGKAAMAAERGAAAGWHDFGDRVGDVPGADLAGIVDEMR